MQSFNAWMILAFLALFSVAHATSTDVYGKENITTDWLNETFANFAVLESYNEPGYAGATMYDPDGLKFRVEQDCDFSGICGIIFSAEFNASTSVSDKNLSDMVDFLNRDSMHYNKWSAWQGYNSSCDCLNRNLVRVQFFYPIPVKRNISQEEVMKAYELFKWDIHKAFNIDMLNYYCSEPMTTIGWEEAKRLNITEDTPWNVVIDF